MVCLGTALGSAIDSAALAVAGFERLSWLGARFVAPALATLALPPAGPQRPRRAEWTRRYPGHPNARYRRHHAAMDAMVSTDAAALALVGSGRHAAAALRHRRADWA